MVVALKNLTAGQDCVIDDLRLTLQTAVPARHKVYVRALAAGVAARMYGMPVGRTRRCVRAGELVSNDNLQSLNETGDEIPIQAVAWRPPLMAGLPTTFKGYVRADGRVGTRNYLLVVHTILCTQQISRRIADLADRTLGRAGDDPWLHYARTGELLSHVVHGSGEGLDGVVVLQHHSGCGLTDGRDLDNLLHYMAAAILHPNVAGALVIGLGCEKTPPHRLQALLNGTWKPVITLTQQALGSEDALLRAALDAIRDMAAEARRHHRQPVPVSALSLGLQCGGSDGFSGITANPALGLVSDCLVHAGGTVILPETSEMVGAERLLARRAVDAMTSKAVISLVQDFAAYARRSGAHLNENLSLGNLRQGLITIEMKALGAVQKAGSSPIVGVLDYMQSATGPGLYLLNTPGYDVLSVAATVASGANIVAFTTGLGTPTGHPFVPVLKIASNSETAQNMADVIDFDAGRALRGTSLEQLGRELYQLMVAVASGQPTANERLRHRESAFWQREAML